MARSLKKRLRCRSTKTHGFGDYWECCQCKRQGRLSWLGHPDSYTACPACGHVRCPEFVVKERKNPTRFNRSEVI